MSKKEKNSEEQETKKAKKTKPIVPSTFGKFADTNFDYVTVYDKDGNDITPK